MLLNPEQRAVVSAPPGPLLVLAGAGTGKTQTLIQRLARFLSEGISPRRLLLLTFSQRAAQEMAIRVERLSPGLSAQLYVGTFHRLALELLRPEAKRLGYREAFKILSQVQAEEIINTLLRPLPQETRALLPSGRRLHRLHSLARNRDEPLEKILLNFAPQWDSVQPLLEDLLSFYQAQKRALNVMDYDDLLVYWRWLLETQEDLYERYAQRYQQILVDEYQDSNRLQLAILRSLSAVHRGITAVGDDWQAIYRFRGAELHNILQFEASFSDSRCLKLQTSYRCSPQILSLALASIRHNQARLKKDLQSAMPEGPKPQWLRPKDPEAEGWLIIQKLKELEEEGLPLHEIAILYRAHAHCRTLQRILETEGLPVQLRSRSRLLEQKHVQDLLAHLTLLFSPGERGAWLRCFQLQRGLGLQSAEHLLKALGVDPWEGLNQPGLSLTLPPQARRGFGALRQLLHTLPGMSPPEMLAAVAQHLQLEGPQLRDLEQLQRAAMGVQSYPEFLERLSLGEREAALKPGALCLSTIHQAKGLEWSAVFVIHLSEGAFPAHFIEPEELEEERRLFHVAVSRARRWLYLSSPQRLRQTPSSPSFLLQELPQTLTTPSPPGGGP